MIFFMFLEKLEHVTKLQKIKLLLQKIKLLVKTFVRVVAQSTVSSDIKVICCL